MEKTPNFTDAQVAVIDNWNNGGSLNLDDAKAIAADERMNGPDGPRNYRSIVAKITRHCPDRYQRKVAARKDGTAVESKAELAKQIAAAVGVTFENLTNAARGDLVKLRDFTVRKAA